EVLIGAEVYVIAILLKLRPLDDLALDRIVQPYGREAGEDGVGGHRQQVLLAGNRHPIVVHAALGLLDREIGINFGRDVFKPQDARRLAVDPDAPAQAYVGCALSARLSPDKARLRVLFLRLVLEDERAPAAQSVCVGELEMGLAFGIEERDEARDELAGRGCAARLIVIAAFDGARVGGQSIDGEQFIFFAFALAVADSYGQAVALIPTMRRAE